MAVDFSRLPVAVSIPDDKPRFWLWMLVFVVLTLAGVATVLLMWPTDMPTKTWQFWITLIGFPTAMATLVVLRRYAMHEGKVLDAMAHNEVCQQYRTQVVDYASQPLALVGSAYVIFGDENQNRDAVKAIVTGALRLDFATPPIAGAQAVKARWLETPDVPLHGEAAVNDRGRQYAILNWLFAQLIQRMVTNLQALPARVPVSVQLSIAGALPAEAIVGLWRTAWDANALRPTDVSHVATTPDLMALDDWLDHGLQTADQDARLIVTVQLNTLLESPPSEGVAEAAVAVLMMPEALAYRHRIATTHFLHRPERTSLEHAGKGLTQALQWARLEGKSMEQVWHTGLGKDRYGQWSGPANQQGVEAKDVCLDTSAGKTGIAAPWLALACAHAAANDGRARLLLCAQEQSVDCAVLRGPPQAPKKSAAVATTVQ